jgi:Holliday junction resolvase
MSYVHRLDRERRLRESFNRDGWVAVRVAKGPIDLVLVQPGEVRFVQIKSTVHPFEHFGPADRTILADLAEQAGATAWLIHWPPRRGWRWIPATDWPAPTKRTKT